MTERCWLVRGAEAHRVFTTYEEAEAFAGEWGKIIPMVEEAKAGDVIARLREALQEIIRVDDTGPTVYEIRANGPSQALGGSKGTFANIAHAALAGGSDA